MALIHLIQEKADALKVALWKRMKWKSLRGMVTKAANKKFLVATQGIIVNDEKEILLLKHTYRKLPWGVPGGWLVYEAPDVGLMREIAEETGFEVEIQKLLQVEYCKSIYKVNAIEIWFLGRYIKGAFVPSAEVSDYGFFSIDSLPDPMPQNQKHSIKKYWETVFSSEAD